MCKVWRRETRFQMNAKFAKRPTELQRLFYPQKSGHCTAAETSPNCHTDPNPKGTQVVNSLQCRASLNDCSSRRGVALTADTRILSWSRVSSQKQSQTRKDPLPDNQKIFSLNDYVYIKQVSQILTLCSFEFSCNSRSTSTTPFLTHHFFFWFVGYKG